MWTKAKIRCIQTEYGNLCDVFEREGVAFVFQEDDRFAGSAADEFATRRLPYNLRFDFVDIWVFRLGYV